MQQLKMILGNKYSEQRYKEFVRDFLCEVDASFHFEIEIPSQFKEYIYKCSVLGKFKDTNNKTIAILSIQTKEFSKARTTQRNFVANLLSNGDLLGFDAALVAFYDNISTSWKLSFVTMEADFNNDKIEFKFKPAKRFSFSVGEGEPSKTYISQLYPIYNDKRNKPLYEDIITSFSVNKVTEDFYKEYSNKYRELASYLSTNPNFINEGEHLGYVNNGDKENSILKFASSFTKKTLGQVVFLHFVQKKGWLGVPANKNWGEGNKNYIYESAKNFKGKNFFNDFLEPLFYNGLNSKRENDLYNGIKIPFLNGGLFQPFENYKWKITDFNIPNDFWYNKKETGFLDILYQYNFTIDEADPNEQEIAVDPEMLGRIFESLLEINERKDKGAFYTPREIVHFMCVESLARRLSNDLSLDYNSIKHYILYNDALKETNNIKEYADVIDMAISKYAVLDPAVGSGAFLVGMLNEIVKLRMNLTQFLTDKSNRTRYSLKKECIENSLYGVDVEFDAVEIAKLRLWLSLIVDENAYDISPEPLPNLQYCIRVGDSLCDKYHGISLWNSDWKTKKKRILDSRQLTLFLDGDDENFNLIIDDILNAIKISKKKYFTTYDENEKQRLLNRISDLQMQLIDAHLRENGQEDLIKEIHSMENKKTKPFFIWDLEFSNIFSSTNAGFDIVIGNPPYVPLQRDQGRVGEKYEKLDFKTFTKMGDLYCLFYEQGYNLLKNNGVLTFITSNKWMRAGYGEKLRDFLVTKTNPVLLVDLGGTKVFDSATVDVNILQFEKSKNQKKTSCCTLGAGCSKNLSVYIEQNIVEQEFEKDSWIILNRIENDIRQKIISKGRLLKDFNISINYGIKTGFNEAFIIDEDTKNKLLIEDSKSAEIIRPILRGRDITRFGYEFKNLYIICTFPSKKIQIDEYPAVKNYLLSFGMKKLEQTGKEYEIDGVIIKSRKKTSNKWFETQDSISYWDDFLHQKLVWTPVNSEYRFALLPADYYFNNSLFMISGENLELLCGLFNSNLYIFYLDLMLSKGNYNYGSSDFFKSIYLFYDHNDKTTMISNLVKEITSSKNVIEKDHLIAKLNDLVYELYEINEKEVEYINDYLKVCN